MSKTFKELGIETVLMHGPAFDGSGDIVEREVPVVDKVAFINAGYVVGANPVKTLEEAVAKAVKKGKK